jgi:hypothetical protein
LTVNGTTADNVANITSGGAQTYNGAVTLANGNQTITGVGNTFNGTISGSATSFLTVNDSGTSNYNGAIAVGSLTTDFNGGGADISKFSANVTVNGAAPLATTPLITINDPGTGSAAGIIFKSVNGGQISLFGSFGAASNPILVDTTGTVAITGTGVTGGNTNATALRLVTVPVNITTTAAGTLFYQALTSPPTRVFFKGSSVSFFEGVSGTSVVQAANAASLTQQATVSSVQASAAAAVSEASKVGFDTDSVAQQINYGFAGDVGVAPPFEHRIFEFGLFLPEGFGEDEAPDDTKK